MFKIKWITNDGKEYIEFRKVKDCKKYIRECLENKIYYNGKNDFFLITNNICSVHFEKVSINK